MSKPRADFRTVADLPDVLAIVDLNLGNMSVTNDAESVVAILARSLDNRRLIYRDSNGRWDELVYRDGAFVGFSPIGVEVLSVALEVLRGERKTPHAEGNTAGYQGVGADKNPYTDIDAVAAALWAHGHGVGAERARGDLIDKRVDACR